MFALRVSADGRVVEIPDPPADLLDSPADVTALLFSSIAFDWAAEPWVVIENAILNDVTGAVVVAVGNTNTDLPVNLPGEKVLSALGLEFTDGGWPEDGAIRDSVWVLQTVPGDLNFTRVADDLAETVKRAAESAPVTGQAVASVHIPDDDPDAALSALVASLGELDGVAVLTMDPRDPAATLAALAGVLGEALPDDVPDGSRA